MISVCIATFNGEKYIKEQIISIISQLSEGDEIIVSDDGSKDHTIEVIKDLQDPRIKIFKNNGIHGYTGNFYNALKLASGEYIFISDQDDIWLPNKVNVSLKYLELNDFVVSDAMEVDKNLTVINGSRFALFNIKKGYINNLCRCRYLGCCMAFNRKVLEALLPAPTFENKYPYDFWIALVAEKYFKTSLISEPLILYRRHGDNASNGGVKSQRSLLKRIFSRIYYHTEIMKIEKRIL